MAAKRASSPKTRTRAAKRSKPGAIPEVIYAQASPVSVGGVSLFEAQQQITSRTVASFVSDEDLSQRSARALTDAGFQVLQISPLTINFAGSKRTFERAFRTSIVAEERPVIKGGGVKTTATFLECPDTLIPGLIATRNTPFADLLEGVALEEPRYFMAASMFPPLKKYWHLDVPAGVSLGCNADKAHRSGITGKNVKVAMCDTGHFKHPFFAARGYRVAPVVLGPATANPLADESGHGTGESANIFSVAPDAELLPVKISFVNTIGGFNAAVGLNPHIITCSWGSSKEHPPLSAADQALAAALAAAVAAGIVVVFAAGNGQWGFPGQHPDVISAGGVFMDVDESLRASNYASGFASNIYPGRNVPDLCGLVGQKPKAIYIMLPLEPGDAIDVGNAGGTHPNGDETASNDGWAAFSGTSAAAPQLAGAAALIKEACDKLTPAQVREVLVKGAKDVSAGNCNVDTGGHAAVPGPDLATGTGLVDAHKSVLLAKVKCLPVITGPIVGPQPIRPAPVTIGPLPPRPPQPIVAPVVNPPPLKTVTMADEGAAPELQAVSKLTAEDVEALQELVIKSDVDV
jgi:subtilisin family serine protease